jgi:hypothetical protein
LSWQPAQAGVLEWTASFSRMVASGMGGSGGISVSGRSGTGWHRTFSLMKRPRCTGRLCSAPEKATRKLGWVRIPARCPSGKVAVTGVGESMVTP